VKNVGVIPIPEVLQYEFHPSDKFIIMASDGVWEFISSQEAVDIVQSFLHLGATFACQQLIQTAATRWQEEEGDYRDDVCPHLFLSFPDISLSLSVSLSSLDHSDCLHLAIATRKLIHPSCVKNSLSEFPSCRSLILKSSLAEGSHILNLVTENISSGQISSHISLS
jgi:hypothetical protein